MKAQYPNDSYFQLINRLFSSTDSIGGLSGWCQTGGRLNLHKALTSVSSRPKNDDFSSSYELAIPSGQAGITATGNNVDATPQSGEPGHAGSAPSRSVWWHWTPGSSGNVEIRTQGSKFNTRLAVYTGSSISALTLVANHAAPDCSWSQVYFPFAAGTTYRIAVDGISSAVGSIKLTVQTNALTTLTNLSFDRGTLSRPSGQFSVRIVGPALQPVSLDRFASTTKYWTNHATFTLSISGTYDYTDSAANGSYALYRCQIGGLKSCNAVGYADVAMPAGYCMIANPFNAVDNRVSALLPNMPDGASLFKWDELNDQYFEANLFVTGYGWTDTNMTLLPGEGAVVSLFSSTTKSFVGEYLQGYLINPVASGPCIRASKTPLSGPVASGLGAPIRDGDIVTRIIGGVFKNFAYRNGIWNDDNGAKVAEPVIAVGESFWINKPTDSKKISSVWP